MNNFDITVGQGYTKEALEGLFATNFGARIKGITQRRDINNQPYIMVFSRATGPYSDRIEGTSFYYDGEGKDKDQQLTVANKALAEANTTGHPIYGFRQEEAGGLWQFIGLLHVVDYIYAKKNSYLTYEFHFTTEPVSPAQLVQADQIIEAISLEEPTLTGNSHKVMVSLTARNAAFSKNVKRIYDNTCAICGKKRFSVSGYPEVEAAHIYPKEKNGSDDYRNGLALCKLHHWAFDSGLLAISDKLKILVKPDLLDDSNYLEIYQYADNALVLPKDDQYKPHTMFLEAHRDLHGF
jgi:putative restriction endonuclease